MHRGRFIAGVVAALFAVPAVAGAATAPAPTYGKCPVFPRSVAWNQPVTKLPVLAGSTAMVNTIGANNVIHPDWGSGLWNGGTIGVPINVVSALTRPLGIHLSFTEPDASDNVAYPLPTNTVVESTVRNPDRHVIVVDRSACRLYELFSAKRTGDGGWDAYSGATWNLRSPDLRPDGDTSADAAGLPMFPLMVRPDEVKKGRIDHALRIVVPKTRKGWIYPARHSPSDSTDPNLPVMGQRLRLKRSVDVNRFPRQIRPVVRALKTYGAIVADEGAPWHVTGMPSSYWDMDQVYSLEKLHGSDLEVVDTSHMK